MCGGLRVRQRCFNGIAPDREHIAYAVDMGASIDRLLERWPRSRLGCQYAVRIVAMRAHAQAMRAWGDRVSAGRGLRRHLKKDPLAVAAMRAAVRDDASCPLPGTGEPAAASEQASRIRDEVSRRIRRGMTRTPRSRAPMIPQAAATRGGRQIIAAEPHGNADEGAWSALGNAPSCGCRPAWSRRMRRISRIACGVSCTLCPDGTTSSLAAPGRWALV